jgi:pimeloyl-ACP methyl ester carboxylesterase
MGTLNQRCRLGQHSQKPNFYYSLAVLVIALAMNHGACHPASAPTSRTPPEASGPRRGDIMPDAEIELQFTSENAALSGTFYTPAGAPPWPLVVMAHGFSATRAMTADKYAAVLRSAGLAVLLYDHRGFGRSGGEPRLQINPWVQARGYRDAITFGATLKGVDASRIGIWGDSFSGGVALAVAAIDRRVAALVIQVPAIGTELPPSDPEGALCRAFEQTLLTGHVEPSAEEVDGPMPVVSDDQARRPSALKPMTAYRWFSEYGGHAGSGWVNEITRARPRTPVAWHAALCASKVTCPSLFMVAPDDEMPASMPTVARNAFEKLSGPKEWVDIEGGHFGLLYHPSPIFEQAASAQARFFARHLARR